MSIFEWPLKTGFNVFLKESFEIVNSENKSADNKNHEKIPSMHLELNGCLNSCF